MATISSFEQPAAAVVPQTSRWRALWRSHGLPTAETFRRMVRRERDRAERAASEFCVVTLRIARPQADRKSLARLARLLKPRLRSSDGLGWIDGNCAGALLSGTSAAEAWKLVQAFAADLPADTPRPVYQVLAFPHDWVAMCQILNLSPDADGGTLRARGDAPASLLARILRRETHPELARLPSARNLHKMLERERSRTDRTEAEFALITLQVEGASRSRGKLAQLVRSLKPRLRAADTLGWLDRNTLALVLPSTTAADAWSMLRSLPEKLGNGAPTFQGNVYGYPSNWLTSQVPWSQAVQPLADGGEPVRPMELFFVSPLPRWKRALDIVGAAVGGTLLLPLLAATALAIRIGSPGPVIFAQPRTGRGGRKFTMYKFRTMVPDAEAQKQTLMAMNEQDGPAFKITHDPRITPLGRFLRKTSIDELPQLWNVLRGEMSLVGPRPLPCSEQDQCHGWYRRRLEVTPGLTCIWQANGGLGVTFHEWMRMDARYAKARTALHDVQLIARTVLRVVKRKASR